MSNLTPDQTQVLWTMQQEDEELWLCAELAHFCRLSPRGMGQRMRGLEAKGLVERLVARQGSAFSDTLYGWTLTDAGRAA